MNSARNERIGQLHDGNIPTNSTLPRENGDSEISTTSTAQDPHSMSAGRLTRSVRDAVAFDRPTARPWH
jgi:hypothetical protein